MWSPVGRGIVILIVALVAIAAMNEDSYKTKPTAPMPAVNVPQAAFIAYSSQAIAAVLHLCPVLLPAAVRTIAMLETEPRGRTGTPIGIDQARSRHARRSNCDAVEPANQCAYSEIP
jgi:hypothetical protein